MSGIARLLLARGLSVSGSDLKDSRALGDLRELGARIFVGHHPHQVGTPDVVVVSTAIPERNPELVEARGRGIRVLARAQVLAALAEGRRTLAVAGTHGKTTTTSMLAVVLERAGRDPTYVIGGDLNEVGSGARHGNGEEFVAEADESDGSFLLLQPAVAVVTNVEEDHLDFYRGGRQEIEAAFAAFLRRCRLVVACGDDPGARRALELAGAPAATYGLHESNAATVRIVGSSGALTLDDGRQVRLDLPVPGPHNLLNAAAAVLVARAEGVDPEEAAHHLRSFGGVRRRFEPRGSANGVRFVDDYAHHPTEIAATLDAARRDGGERLVVVFQPHRYTRTQAFWRQLGESLAGADVVLVTEVYAAGEDPIPGVSGRLVAEALAASSSRKTVVFLPRRADVAHALAERVRGGDLVLTMGAGDVTTVADETLALLRGVR
jgi:UDP-N-acetylmuramate--alanine ligase